MEMRRRFDSRWRRENSKNSKSEWRIEQEGEGILRSARTECRVGRQFEPCKIRALNEEQADAYVTTTEMNWEALQREDNGREVDSNLRQVEIRSQSTKVGKQKSSKLFG